MNNTKKILRNFYRKERVKIRKEKLKESSDRIFETFKTLDIFSETFFHIYLSNELNKEVSTDKIFKYLLSINKRIVVPKIHNNQLIHHEINYNSKYKTNNYGIREPIESKLFDVKKIQVVIVPLLIFDKNGHRVGYGGGYYDKFLATVEKDTLKIGLSLFDPVNNIQDINMHDILINKVITPRTLYNFY
tara:strand:+ start:43416 stop:43982 length:567 start_codon:yes stop_codon:yes gene_type:complete